MNHSCIRLLPSTVFASYVRSLVLLCTLCVPLPLAANPIMPGADPHALVVGDTVWIYPTETGGRGERFFAFSSRDLSNLQRYGPVLDFQDVAWIKDDGREIHHAWAPAVLTRQGKYYFYYSVGPQNPTPSRIGVAVGDAPQGPFRDSGKPLLTGGNGFEAIDPMVFEDPKSGTTYLYAGGSAGAKLRVFELNPDLMSLARETPVETPPEFTEGVFMHYHEGRYYLSYSHGSWQRSSYSVHYATADAPTGPWTYRGVILASDETSKGPGHHSFIRSPLTGQWRIVYHRWENRTGDGPYRGRRQICIDTVEYDENGLIRPIVMTGSLNRKKDAAPAPAGIRLEYENPVWGGYLADPQVLKTGGEYYAYGTGPAHKGRQFPVLHSKDFAHWEFLGNALETLVDPKVKAYWAPEVAEKDGRFYLYYAGEYRMRVAVADRPAGPFQDSGRILFPDEPFSIDGHPYRDPGSGKWYLFFAKDFLDQRVGTALAVAELSDDMISVTGSVRTVLRAVGDWQIYERHRTMYGRVFDAWHTVEAPFVVLRGGRYYCFYSGGNWQTPGYGVGFAVADRATGPYQDEADLEGAAVLKSIPGKLIGPGHNSVVLGPDDQTHFIVYHSWNPERTKRQMCLDPIEWTPQGPRADNPSRGKRVIILPRRMGATEADALH